MYNHDKNNNNNETHDVPKSKSTLSEFQTLTEKEVNDLVFLSPNKFSTIDPHGYYENEKMMYYPYLLR